MSEESYQRYRILPSQGQGHSFWHFGNDKTALAAASEYSREYKMPVLVICAPEKGIRRTVAIIGGKKTRR